MTDQPANLDLDEIATRAGHLWEYVQQPDEADILAGTDVPALIAEVRRLRAVVDHVVQIEEREPNYEMTTDPYADGWNECLEAVREALPLATPAP